MGTIAQQLARTGEFPAEVQAVIAHDRQLGACLADNTEIALDRDVWFTLYTVKPKVASETACGLARRPLDNDQIEHMLACETRVGPWLSAFAHNELTADQQARLVSAKGVKGGLAATLLDYEWFDRTLAKDIVLAAGGASRYSFLVDADDTQLSQAEAEDWARTLPDWAPSKVTSHQASSVERLVEHRLYLVSILAGAGQPERIRRQLAGSRFATDESVQFELAGIDGSMNFAALDWDAQRAHGWLLTKLVFSPVCHKSTLEKLIEVIDAGDQARFWDVKSKAQSRLRDFDTRGRVTVPYEQVDNVDQLGWLVNRSIPNDRYDRMFWGRPWDLAALAFNEYLDDTQALRVIQALRLPYIYNQLKQRGLDAEAALVERHPTLGPAQLKVSDTEGRRPRVWNDPTANWPTTVPDGIEGRHLGPYTGVTDVSRYLVRELSGPGFEQRWQLLLSMIDEFDGTVGDLVEVCSLICTSDGDTTE
jgi:hypothetical protein